MRYQLQRNLVKIVPQVAILLIAILFGLIAFGSPGYAEQAGIRSMLVGPMQLPDEEYLLFVERVKPELVVMGAFGAPQWATQDDPRLWLAKWREVFTRLHRSDIRVVGTFELLNVGNSPQEAKKFVDFFESRWDTKILGQRPPVRGASLLEQRTLPIEKQVSADAPRGCPVNQHWRSMAKAMVKPLIDAGIDGFITHRNMFGECGCPFCHADLKPGEKTRHSPHEHDAVQTATSCDHCGLGFRRWMADRYTPVELKAKFDIGDLQSHKLLAVYGHHREHGRLPTALQMEGMRFARHAIKECFDDVFVEFGRGLKPDLLVAQWNHMPYFDEMHRDRGHISEAQVTTFAHASADERWSLPANLWGRGEDLYWYCNWGTCQNTEFEKRFVADVTLYAKLLRSQSRGKPYVINKYDFYRPRNMLAEAAALGMIAGAKDVPYRAEQDAETAVRYFEFLRRHASLYRNNNGRPISDVLLVYPRTQSHAGDASGLEMVEVAGRTMIVDGMQFDIVPDDLLADVKFENYRAVVATSPKGLDAEQLKPFFEAGGSVIAIPRDEKLAVDPAWVALKARVVKDLPIHSGGSWRAAALLAELNRAVGVRRLQVETPYRVETHFYQQGDDFVVHFVNYDHEENAKGNSVVEREAPIAAKPIPVTLALPDNAKVKRITFLDPDSEQPNSLEFERSGNSVLFKTPSFLVYGVCVVELQR